MKEGEGTEKPPDRGKGMGKVPEAGGKGERHEMELGGKDTQVGQVTRSSVDQMGPYRGIGPIQPSDPQVLCVCGGQGMLI